MGKFPVPNNNPYKFPNSIKFSQNNKYQTMITTPQNTTLCALCFYILGATASQTYGPARDGWFACESNPRNCKQLTPNPASRQQTFREIKQQIVEHELLGIKKSEVTFGVAKQLRITLCSHEVSDEDKVQYFADYIGDWPHPFMVTVLKPFSFTVNCKINSMFSNDVSKSTNNITYQQKQKIRQVLTNMRGNTIVFRMIETSTIGEVKQQLSAIFGVEMKLLQLFRKVGRQGELKRGTLLDNRVKAQTRLYLGLKE